MSTSPRVLAGERGHMPTTVKRPVGWPRKRKPSVETPPVPNINRAGEILGLSDDVGQADSMLIQDEAEDACCNANTPVCLARSN